MLVPRTEFSTSLPDMVYGISEAFYLGHLSHQQVQGNHLLRQHQWYIWSFRLIELLLADLYGLGVIIIYHIWSIIWPWTQSPKNDILEVWGHLSVAE